MATSVPVPKEWPADVSKEYEPVRVLGVGGFASVTLARKKNAKEGDDKLVAIKIAGSKDSTRKDVAYAHREIDILKEIDHKNIMKLITYWEPSPKEHLCAAVIALSYHKGPTVESLLNHGGALSQTFGRVVIAQVIDAISYLHSHAVIHRDIKPDNIIVTGASAKDDTIWNEAADPAATSFEDLCKKWSVVLIDFGFARALTPDDVVKPSLEIKRENLDASYHVNKRTEAIKSENLGGSSRSRARPMGGSIHGKSIRNILKRDTTLTPKGDDGELNRSISRKMMRQMSALGNRNFAAPEIINKVQEQKQGSSNVTDSDEVDVTDTISDFVSEYGLLVDAYSLGCTMRYMMTGVQPHIRVESVLAERKSMGYRMGRWIGKKTGSIDKNGRKKRVVLTSELSVSCQHLIAAMVEKDQKSRLSVRAARRNPWIAEVLDHGNSETKDQVNEMSYLPCAMKHHATPAVPSS